MNKVKLMVVALATCLSFGIALSSSIAQDNDDDRSHGWLEIYSNYGAQVTVNGQPYPKRSDFGMKLEAAEIHTVHVKMGEKEKTYNIQLRPREKRILMVDITGYKTPPTPAPSPKASPQPSKKDEKKKEEDKGDEQGKLTVYSKPKGDVFVDGSGLGATTPMINRELDVGRHEVQVKWEDGRMSEIKTIRIRKGSKLKLFFRDRDKK